MEPVTRRRTRGRLDAEVTPVFGAQTALAVANFPFGVPMPAAFVSALALLKAACAHANTQLGYLDVVRSDAIVAAALEVAQGQHAEQFPVDVYQTGSGTSSNMNANEVIATLAQLRCGFPVHPNDHVNFGQSSNDVVPSAIQVSAVLAARLLLTALEALRATILVRARELRSVVKTGRTHLMDAMPLTLGQELNAWAAQLEQAAARVRDTLKRVRQLPLGGTAIGTGINVDPGMAGEALRWLNAHTGERFVTAKNRFIGIAAKDECVELSGQLNALACALMKIANDLRWMNSGPLAGLGELELPALQAGSSIMPGKVNPVIPEALAMICAQVMGNHVTITIAGQSGNFQLNVMLPVIAHNLLSSMHLLSLGMQQLATRVIADFKVQRARLASQLARNPILVTALNPILGYEQAAALAKQAYAQNKPILEVVLASGLVDPKLLDRLLDPLNLTLGGVTDQHSGSAKLIP